MVASASMLVALGLVAIRYFGSEGEATVGWAAIGLVVVAALGALGVTWNNRKRYVEILYALSEGEDKDVARLAKAELVTISRPLRRKSES
jgi:hypothetical protein